MKTKTRILAEQIREITGDSLFLINNQAMEYVAMGAFPDREAALEYMLEISKEA